MAFRNFWPLALADVFDELPWRPPLDPAALLLTSRSLRRTQESIGKQNIGCLNAISAKHPKNGPIVLALSFVAHDPLRKSGKGIIAAHNVSSVSAVWVGFQLGTALARSRAQSGSDFLFAWYRYAVNLAPVFRVGAQIRTRPEFASRTHRTSHLRPLNWSGSPAWQRCRAGNRT